MDNLDQLADDELRLRLVQYGFPNLPVTSTTRKILIKKLRHHIDTENQKLRRESSKAARYSSGEESDGNDGRKTVTAAQRKMYTTTTSSSSSSNSSTTRSQRATVGSGFSASVGSSVSMPPPAPANVVRSSITRVPISISSSPSSSASTPHSVNSNSNSFAGTNGASPNNHRSSSKNSSPTVGSTVYISPLIVHDSEEEDYSPPLRAGIG
uniref:LEM domain-containing protein n=1 Tax=Anopheles maculatus TaxID=74869 RepID=A0A182SAE8_9DIPT